MSVVERCQFEVTFSVTIGNPILSSYVRRRKMSVWGYIQCYNRKPYIKQLCQTSKDVSLRLHSVLQSETLYQAAMSDVERCQYAVALLQPCINRYIRRRKMSVFRLHQLLHPETLCQAAMSDTIERCQFADALLQSYIKRLCQTSKHVTLRLHRWMCHFSRLWRGKLALWEMLSDV